MKVRQTLAKGCLALIVVVILSNILFWVLVGTQFSLVKDEYDYGRIIRVGRMAFVFGHGEWITEKGVEQHYTTAFLHEGVDVKRPTLEVVQELHHEGVTWIWGTWCYSGDHSFIRRDEKSGKETPWPGYVSRNMQPGETLPVWLGLGFVRLSVGSRHRHSQPLPDAATNGIRMSDLAPFISPRAAFPQSFQDPMIRF